MFTLDSTIVTQAQAHLAQLIKTVTNTGDEVSVGDGLKGKCMY